MRRPATREELNELFRVSPWNESYGCTEQAGNIIQFEMNRQTFPSISFRFRNNLIIDDNDQVVSPLNGIACPELAKFLRLPADEITGCAKLLFGAINPTVDRPVFDMTGDSSTWTHMLKIERYESTFVRGREDWRGSHVTIAPQDLHIWRANSAIDREGIYWSFTLFPIGYCQPEYSPQNGGVCKILAPDGTTHTGSYFDLQPHIDDITRRLAQAAIDVFELHYDLERNNNTTIQLCQKYSEELQQIQQIAGFEDLKTDVKPYDKDGHDFELNGRLYKRLALVDYISKLRRNADYYQRFRPTFESLRKRIEDAYGWLDTYGTSYAEVWFQVPTFGTNDPGWEVRRFHYSDPGVAGCILWITEQEQAIKGAQMVMEGAGIAIPQPRQTLAT